MLVSVAYYGRQSMLEWLFGLPIEAKKWKLYYQPRWAGGITVFCASLRMSGVQALLLVARDRSGVGIFSVGHAHCVP